MSRVLRAVFIAVVLSAILSLIGCGRPDPATTHLQKAARLLVAKKYGAARRQIDAAIAEDPTNVSTYLAAMGLYHQADRHEDEAEAGELLIEQAKRAKTKPKLAPDQVAAVYASVGRAYWDARQLSAAEDAYLHAIRLAPDNGMLNNDLGYFYADQNIRINEALRLTRKAVKLVPDDGLVLDSLWWALYRNGNYASASRTLHKAVELSPDDGQLRYHLGAAYAKLGRKSSASVELRKALLLDASLAEAKRLLATVRA